MKACKIYKTEKSFIIITTSETDIGLFLDDEPIFKMPLDSNANDLFNKVNLAMNSSRINIATPSQNKWKAWQEHKLKQIGMSSYNSLYKKSRCCSISINKNKLKVLPYKLLSKNTPSKGLVAVEEDIIEISVKGLNDIKLVEIILQVLNKQY